MSLEFDQDRDKKKLIQIKLERKITKSHFVLCAAEDGGEICTHNRF
jgi:hypothetical protein